MKILHTADWHIGQLFHEYDRTYEHQQFLNWLVDVLQKEQVDVLLVSGDVFDLSNPSAASVRMFYTFLNNALKANPDIQIIITAGNHDSAPRLESPKPLLESSNIHIIGLIEKDAEGDFDYDKLIIPIKNKKGQTAAWCMAIPFLRMGDYPVDADAAPSYVNGVTAMYEAVYEYTVIKNKKGLPVIAMGHLHAHGVELSDADKTERPIMGGVDCIPASAFHKDLCYVALGHIHKAQKVGKRETVRYSGSPIPMSFSEHNYKHQVMLFEIEGDKMGAIQSIEVPLCVALQRVPAKHQPLTAVLTALQNLQETAMNGEPAPYIEVRVLLDGPEPALRHKIETALKGKYVRLAKIDVKYAVAEDAEENDAVVTQEKLHALQPLDVFSKIYQSKYNAAVPEDLLQLFNKVAQEVTHKEEE